LFVAWEDKLPLARKRLPNLLYKKILVPMIETLRNLFAMQVICESNLNELFFGLSDSGKASFIENTF
jgi:hypothetical protein